MVEIIREGIEDIDQNINIIRLRIMGSNSR